MNYVKVLEHQIVELEEVQEKLIKKVESRKENVTCTERALNVIASTSSRIQSIVVTLVEMQNTPSLTLISNGQCDDKEV